ncbi:unnamed protein product, partial [Staurois parvus]
ILTEGHNEIPWKAVHYLTGEVVYGGRVTDLWDRRCLLSILDIFYNPAVLQDGYSFSEDKVYQTITDNVTLWECRDYISSLPDTDTPQIFGMHPDADRAFLTSQAQLFTDTIVSMQPRISAEYETVRGDSIRDEMVVHLATSILSKLPVTVEGRMEQDKSAAISDKATTVSS